MPEKKELKNFKFKFGDKIRIVRERKGITLKEVAEQADVSESLVSQIERNRVSPSIDTLLAIADVLDIDLEYLFRDYKRTKKVHIVRADKRNSLILKNVKYEQLSVLNEPSKEHAIEALYLEIQPGAEKGDIEYGHKGNELGFIIQGKGELLYGTEVYELNEGDSISFSSDIPHNLKNVGEKVLKAFWVITPPRMIV
jgi:transcriptional regulator with XRE-family HTH domain